MATLTGKTIANTYKDLLQVSNNNSGVDTTMRTVSDGEGTNTALELSNAGVNINGTFQLNGESITVNASAINNMADIGSATGIIAVNSGNVYGRTLTAGTPVSITNANGAAGNPTITLASIANVSGSYGPFTNFGVNDYGQIVSATAVSTSVSIPTVRATELIAETLTLSSNASIVGNLNVDGTFIVDGIVSAASDVAVSGSLYVTSNISVTGNTNTSFLQAVSASIADLTVNTINFELVSVSAFTTNTLTVVSAANITTGSAGSVTASTDADELVLESSGNTGMSILAAASGNAQIYFGEGTDNDAAFIQYNGSLDDLILSTTNASSKLILKADAGVTQVTFDGAAGSQFAEFANDIGLKSDSSKIYFGADNEITLTHTADTGLTLSAGSSGATANSAANTFVVEDNANAGISILSPDANSANLYFGSASDNNLAYLEAKDDGGTFKIGTTQTGHVIHFSSGNNSTALTIDASQRLLIGRTASTITSNALQASLQIMGNAYNNSSISAMRWGANANGATLNLGKSRNATVGSNTVVSNGDELGRIDFSGDDGTDFQTLAGRISSVVNGTPGTGDIPADLVFSPGDGGSVVEAMRLAGTGLAAKFAGKVLIGSGATGSIGGSLEVITGSTGALGTFGGGTGDELYIMNRAAGIVGFQTNSADTLESKSNTISFIDQNNAAIITFTASTTTFAADVKYSATTHNYNANTSDGSDNARAFFTGGGGADANRGSFVGIYGNENAVAGQLLLVAGTGSDGHINFQTGGGETMRLTTTGRLGVGQSDPQAVVDIVGNSDSVPALKIGSNTTHGWEFYELATGGHLRLNRVVSDTSTSVLQIARDSGNITLTPASGSLLFGDTSKGIYYDGNDLRIYTTGTSDFITLNGETYVGFEVNSSPLMRLLPTGLHIGGTAALANETILQVTNSGDTSTIGTATLALNNTNTTAGAGSAILFSSVEDTGANRRGVIEVISEGTQGGAMKFSTRDSAGAGSAWDEDTLILTGGNATFAGDVAIGGAASDFGTQLSGGLVISGVGGNPGIKLANDSTGVGNNQGFDLFLDSAGGVELCSREAQPFKFSTSGNEKARLTSDGDLGLGTDSPAVGTGTFGTSARYLTVTGGANAGVLGLGRDTTANDYSVGGIQFFNANNADNANNDADAKVIADIRSNTVTSDSNAGDDSGGSLLFNTKPEAGSLATAMIITSAQDVGIGTASPSARLQIEDATDQKLILSGSGSPNINLVSSSGDDFLLQNHAGLFRIYNNTDARQDFAIDGAGDATFTGDVGATTAGAQLLVGHGSYVNTGTNAYSQIHYADKGNTLLLGEWSATNASEPTLRFLKSASSTIGTNTLVADGENLGAISFNAADGTDLYSIAATIKAYVDGTPGASDMPGRLEFATSPDGSDSPTTRMLINSSGNVHIGGTSAPSTKLLVTGDAEFTQALNGSAQIVRVKNNYVGNSSPARLIIQTRGWTDSDAIINLDAAATNARWTVGADAAAGKFIIANADLNNFTGSNEVFVIDGATGDVGINTSSVFANSKFEINGAAATTLPTVTITADDKTTGWRTRRTGGTYPQEWYVGLRENAKHLDTYNNTDNTLATRLTTGGNFTAYGSVFGQNGSGNAVFGIDGGAGSIYIGGGNTNTSNIIFQCGASERARITSDSRLGVGTDTPTSGIHTITEGSNYTDGAYLLVESTNASMGGGATFVGFKHAAAIDASWTPFKIQAASTEILKLSSSGGLYVGNATSTYNNHDPFYGFTHDTNTGMDWAAADTLTFKTGGSERLRLTSTGLSIGHASAAEEQLDVAGDTVIRSTGANANGRYWQYVRAVGDNPTNVDIVEATFPDYCTAVIKVRVTGRGTVALNTQHYSEQTYAVSTDANTVNAQAGTQIDIDQAFTLTLGTSGQQVTVDVTGSSVGNVTAYIEILSSAAVANNI